jgi:hypothetical protein
MPELFLGIPLADRAEILQSIAPAIGLPPHVLEKDVWVCWALQAVFEMPDRLPIAFKGGTSLSKVFGAIRRFSEDIDLTIDYTALSEGVDPLATEMSRTAIAKLTEKLRGAVAAHVRNVVAPYLARVGREQLNVELQIDVDEGGEELRIRYPSPYATGATYLRDSVLLEFGGRNTTLPNAQHRITPYAAEYVGTVQFPVAMATVLSPQRTFWEKATLIHSECHRPQEGSRASAERISRHWSDLALLAQTDIGAAALTDRELLAQVVKLKGIFFRSGFANYAACLEGRFRLIPDEPLHADLAKDYAAMIESGMFLEPPPVFADVMAQLCELEKQLNQV